MTTHPPLGERVIEGYIRPHVESFSGLAFTHNDHTYRITQIPAQLVGRTLYTITDETDTEVFRFTFCFEVSKRVSPNKPLIPLTASRVWIEGQWGPTRTPHGLTYTRTPVAGDTVWSPADESEWVVLKALNPNNLHNVTLVNKDGEKLNRQFNWGKEVRFRRSNIFHATKIVKEMLDAKEVDETWRQGDWIIERLKREGKA